MEAFSVQRLPVHEREGWLIAGKAVGAFSHFYDYLIFQDTEGRPGIYDFVGVCDEIRRCADHFAKFLMSETKINMTFGEKGNLKADAPLAEHDLAAACQAYFEEFVHCKQCHGANTKPIVSRLQGDPRLFISCLQSGCMHDSYVPTPEQRLKDENLDQVIDEIATRRMWR